MPEKRFADGFITVREAATLLNVHKNTIRRWSNRGHLKTYRVGSRGDRRFRREELERFVVSHGELRTREQEQRRVLIVDDDPKIQQLLTDIVEERGYSAIAVGSGKRALEELGNGPFSLIFLDLVLPGLSGLEVLRAIKDRSKRSVVAIIIGHGDEPIALEAMSLGPMFFVRKPFEIEDITKIIDAVMGAQPKS